MRMRAEYGLESLKGLWRRIPHYSHMRALGKILYTLCSQSLGPFRSSGYRRWVSSLLKTTYKYIAHL